MFVQKQNFGVNDTLQFNFQQSSYNYPTHIHQFAELCYVIDGSIELTVNDNVMTFCGDEYVFIAPLQMHGYFTPVQCNAVVMAFPISFLPGMGSVKCFSIGRSTASTSKAASEYFKSIFLYGGLGTEHFAHDLSDSDNITKSFFVDLKDVRQLSRVCSALGALLAECDNFGDESGEAADALPKLLIWLNEHFTESVKLEDAAQALGYSRNYLSHRIKKYSGMTFPELLANLRIEHACELLGKTTITDAALDSGFETVRSFYRAFKKQTGITPGEYLKGKNYDKTVHKA